MPILPSTNPNTPADPSTKTLDALTPESVGAFAAGSAAKDLTILTLGPNPLVLP